MQSVLKDWKGKEKADFRCKISQETTSICIFLLRGKLNNKKLQTNKLLIIVPKIYVNARWRCQARNDKRQRLHSDYKRDRNNQHFVITQTELYQFQRDLKLS